MTYGISEVVAVFLRAITYVGTVAVAGGLLFGLTMSKVNDFRLIRTQVMVGAILIIVSEPLRLALFQLSIAQGDVTLAFGPAMRWIGLETPLGQAAMVRLAGLGMVLLGLVVSVPVATLGAFVLVGSYLIEGHTASSENRYLSVPLLLLHMLAVHWWLGALWPLRTALGRADIPATQISACVRQFGRQALLAVSMLSVAGILTLGLLVGWQLDLSNVYQQVFLIKLGAFAIILLIAAINKVRLTPLLVTNPEAGRVALRRFIAGEMAVALAILAASAIATSFPPSESTH